MNKLEIFKHPEFGIIRAVEIDGEPWLVGHDAATSLGYSNPRDALATHVDDEDKVTVAIHDGTPGNPNMTVINESGLYSLVLSSKLPDAKRRRRWVTAEVLPSIRKHGAYMVPDTIEKLISDPDTIIQLATTLKEEQGRRKALEIANSALTVDKQIMQPKADYFDELVDRNLLTNFRETAKQLGVKQRDFIQFLLNKKYIYRDKRGRLMPYAQHTDNGLFEIKECFNGKTQWSGTQTMVTPKGRETFRLLFIGTNQDRLFPG